jgi:hypothetical protein
MTPQQRLPLFGREGGRGSEEKREEKKRQSSAIIRNTFTNNIRAIQWLARRAARKGHTRNTRVIEKPEGKMLLEKNGCEGV